MQPQARFRSQQHRQSPREIRVEMPNTPVLPEPKYLALTFLDGSRYLLNVAAVASFSPAKDREFKTFITLVDGTTASVREGTDEILSILEDLELVRVA